MEVFVAGGLGAVGRRLVPMLVEAGHQVAATTTAAERKRALFDLGATPFVMDGLDRAGVLAAVARAEPEVVVHEMTDLVDAVDLKHFDRVFANTNRLRIEGTEHLIEAARVVGVRRMVAQSFGNWNYERTGGRVKTEEDGLDPSPPRSMRKSLGAIARLEAAVTGARDLEGIALRYGNLYGPGTGISENGPLVELVRRRRLPLIGDGRGIWSFVHVADAAAATVAAVEGGSPGIYNVCDDDPAAVAVWLPELAAIVGAPSPRHVPEWLGRLAAGEAVVSMFTRTRGASNAKAKEALDWRLRYPSWRDGFRRGLADVKAPKHADPAISPVPWTAAGRSVVGGEPEVTQTERGQ
jgi:2-alkyl-3-oxoalkanoate reductase